MPAIQKKVSAVQKRSTSSQNNFDPYDLVDALMRIMYHGQEASKAIREHLKKTKHISPTGKVTKAGEKLLDDWFTSGSDRMKIAKELN